MTRRLILLAILAFAAVVSNAQQDPDTERGARPGLAYKLTDIDQINLFNGTMTLNLNIGQTYSVNGALSYAFVASYATNSWKTDFNEEDLGNGEVKSFPYMYPSNNDNAGFGWVVTLGQILFDSPNLSIVYLAPDGGQHTFENKLHSKDLNEPDNDSVLYTTDGTYLRLIPLPGAGGYEIDFPNGQKHLFDSSGRLTSIEDAFGNWVHIALSARPPTDPYTGPIWTITDSVQRVHRIYFRPNWAYDTIPVGGSQPPALRYMVDKIVLAAFNGGTATYTFNYTAAPQPSSQITIADKTSRRCKVKRDPFLAEYVVTSLLDSIQGPESVLYSMTYDRGDRENCSFTRFDGASGNLLQMILPTGSGLNGGRIEWTYQPFVFPGSTAGEPSSNAGVKERRAFDGATILTETDYELGSDYRNGSTLDYDVWRRLVNKDGNGVVTNATKHYFTGCRFSVFGCTNGGEYGLPLTRNSPHPSVPTAFLSSEIERQDADGTYTALRRTWIRYEGDFNLANVIPGSYNQRLAYQRTDDEDDKFSDVTYSEFDGLGHFRKSVTGGNFEQNNSRTTFANYNPSAGTYKIDANGNLTAPFHLPAGTWLLGTFNQQWTSEEGSLSSVASFCFDSRGFLTSKRTFKNWGQAPGTTQTVLPLPQSSTEDLLAVFTRDSSGNLVKEQYFGGEVGSAAPTNYACGSALTGETYRLDHGYQFGTRSESHYMQSNGTAMTFDLLDTVVDQNTGLVATSRRYSTVGVDDGTATTYTYDALGRLKQSVGPRLRTQYDYTIRPPSITISDYDTATGALKRTSTAQFDVIGRQIRETRSMPGGTTAARTTQYNALGWKTATSDWGSNFFTVFSYDVFGRPTSIRPPDQTDETALHLAYTGISKVTRTAKVRTNGDATPLTAINYSDAVTTEDYDRQGRLIRVTEPAKSVGGTRPVTEYQYDVAGRLTLVCANKTTGCGQSRTFTYDNRGFLSSEIHPENGTTTYPAYDARGHVRRRFLGSSATPFHHLGFVYDRAERLTQVHEAANDGTETRKLKYFEYGTDNFGSDLRNGRLTGAMRFNWVTVNSTNYNVRVVEAYKYADPDGNVTSRNTSDYLCSVSGVETCQSISAGSLDRQFDQAFTYDALDAPETLDYPECKQQNCVGLIGNRTITNGYDNGLLASVTWSGAVVPNTFTYHPSGLLHEVHHDNGVTDEQTIDPEVPSRPLSLITQNALDGSACVDPAFTIQPQSQTITSTSVHLEALAVGETSPGHTVAYHWYRGTAPDTSNPLGVSSRFLDVTQTVTTSYWVNATNNCSLAGTASVTATVTLCVPPVVSLPPAPTITRTKSVTLTASASGSAVLQYQWYTVSGTTPTQINGATSASLTVSPTQTTRYRVVVTNDCGNKLAEVFVNVVDPPIAPASVSASYNPVNGSNVISWTPSSSDVGIDHYLVDRMPDAFTFSTTATSIQDTVGLLAGHTYIYRIRAVDTQGVASEQSPPDLTTRIAFLDDPIVGGVSAIRGAHISQLRQAIDAVRAAARLAPAWPDYSPLTGPVDASTFTQLFDRLNEARTSLLFPEISPGTIVPSGGIVQGSTLSALRNGVQ